MRFGSALSWLFVMAGTVGACGGGGASLSSTDMSPALNLCSVLDVPIEGKPAPSSTTPIDRSCLGKPFSDGCDAIKLCGNASRIVVNFPLEGATYDFLDADGNVITSATTDANGAYCATIPVGPGGFTGRMRLSKPDYRSHDAYLAAYPYGHSANNVTLGIEKESDLKTLLPAYGAPAPDPNKGIVDPFILDCADNYLPPVAVDIDRAYEKRFYVGAKNALLPDSPGSVAGQLSGALFVNVDPGPVTATFRLLDSNGQPGEVVGTSKGEVRAGHWTALPALPK